MAKLSKNTIIGIVVAVVVVVVIAIVVGVVSNSGNGGDGTDGGQHIEIDEEEFSTIDINIDFGDYAEMEAQAKAIQNGEMVGSIMMIEGIVSHPGNKFSIVEEDENGNKIGTEFVVEGFAKEDYPKEGERVMLTGKVVEKEPMYYVIWTLPDYIEAVTEE